jgi:hypothetical protein
LHNCLRLCSQVNLEESSIRPGRPLEWHRSLKARICGEVAAAAAAGSDVHIHVGNWLHDLRQARALFRVPYATSAALLYSWCVCKSPNAAWPHDWYVPE